MTPQHFIPSLHLVPFCRCLHKYTLCVKLLVVCRGLWNPVQWVVLGMHVGEWVMLLVAAMYNVLAIADHGRYGPSCLYAETVKSINSAGSVWYVWYMVCY